MRAADRKSLGDSPTHIRKPARSKNDDGVSHFLDATPHQAMEKVTTCLKLPPRPAFAAYDINMSKPSIVLKVHPLIRRRRWRLLVMSAETRPLIWRFRLITFLKAVRSLVIRFRHPPLHQGVAVVSELLCFLES